MGVNPLSICRHICLLSVCTWVVSDQVLPQSKNMQLVGLDYLFVFLIGHGFECEGEWLSKINKDEPQPLNRRKYIEG